MFMIRFRCSHCDKTLKVPDDKAGATIVCPRCARFSVAPAETAMAGPEEQHQHHQAVGGAVAHQHDDEAPSLFSGMTQGMRWAVALVAGVGVLSLLLVIVPSLVPALAAVGDVATSWAIPLVPCSVVVLLVILYGHGTSCPACGKWWARCESESKFVDRERFDKDGVRFARSIYRIGYICNCCRHKWSATRTDEYKDVVRDGPKRQ